VAERRLCVVGGDLDGGFGPGRCGCGRSAPARESRLPGQSAKALPARARSAARTRRHLLSHPPRRARHHHRDGQDGHTPPAPHTLNVELHVAAPHAEGGQAEQGRCV